MLSEIGDMQKIMWKECGECFSKKKPEDFVLATGKTTTIREFCNMSFKELGIEIKWEGEWRETKLELTNLLIK